MLRPSARLACLLSLLLIAGVGAPALGATAPSGAATLPPLPLLPSQQPPAPAGSPGRTGYWLVAADGGIFSFGGVPFEGSAGSSHLVAPIVAMAASPSGQGYWLAARDGGVFAYGSAVFAGSPASLPASARPSSPVSAIEPTPDGNGYWIATRAGGVYAFGDAPFAGSLIPVAIGSPVVGMAATPDGGGYWLASADGSVFTFGDARFQGSAFPYSPKKPIVGMAATPDGGGYWLVASDGGIFSFGDARFQGSTGAISLNQPIVGMAPTADGGGYWLVASDGGIFSFGDAPFRGSTGNIRLNQPIVGMAAGTTLDPYQPGSVGYDVSFPQCGGSLPGGPVPFAVVGVNGGRAFTRNPCLAAEAAWAGSVLTLYMNVNAPPPGSAQALSGPAGQCTGNDTGCMAYNYGYNAAVDAFSYAKASQAVAGTWWLDVETANSWDANAANNDRTIQGALDALGAEGVQAGIYSTSYQWGLIAGSYAPGTPVWVATGSDYAAATAACGASYAFGGGKAWLTQFGSSGVPFDQDYACAAG